MPDSPSTIADDESAFFFPLRFWPLQCIGWLGLALATFPLKLYFFENVVTAIWVTLLREGIGFVLTCVAHSVWRRYHAYIDRRPLRQILQVVALALVGAGVDMLLVLLGGYRLSPDMMLDQSFLIVSFGYRALILAIWGLLYFALRGVLLRQRMVIAVREAELRMLRTQTCPHFLFNALNTMMACARKGNADLPDLIQSLASYLRYTLKHHDTSFVPLSEEYAAVLDYLKVEKARFRGDLQIEASLCPLAAVQAVPGILLQPLLENAVRHGRATSSRPLRIRICITQPSDKQIEILVANTGSWRQTQPPHGFGIGLKNLHHRLQLAYPAQDALSITEADGWVCVTLCLPIRYKIETPSNLPVF